MKKQLSMVLAVLFLTPACSWKPSWSWSSLNPFSSSGQEEQQVEEPEVKIGVNPFLWRASLKKLSFMPLASVDSQTGVLVTDWAAVNGISNEQFKITVHILSKNLRADCLKVSVFKRVWANGKWNDEAADRRLSDEIEKAILTEAKDMFIKDAEAEKE